MILPYPTPSLHSLIEEISTGSPKEFKRPPIVNGFVFPIHINDNSCVLYTGRIVGSLMGHGTKEEWSLDGVKRKKKGFMDNMEFLVRN